ncbi:MFS transporter [Desulfuromonas sp.]|uniref:MFS transporter n=1 Tax=Desulfuromonas sp. TaxID=892 RepID=UPI0025BDEB78|nr:MFS transporter [Desulfuromonas sp.]
MDSSRKNRLWFGWCMYDWANSAFATVILAAVLPVYFAALVPAWGARITLFGLSRTVPATALWGYAVSLSMLLVALCAPYLGALADRGGKRRSFLVVFALTGAGATAALFFAGPGNWPLAAGLFILANIGFAGGNVFYNAFLPVLAEREEQDRLSARGFAFGYLGGGLALLLVFVLIQAHASFGIADKAVATRIAFLFTGLWWAVFALPAFRSLKQVPAVPPKSPGESTGYLKAFLEIRGRRDLLLFLVAFLFYNDGIQTFIAVSAIFGREELGLSQGSILGCFLMIQFVAMPGTLLFGRIAERSGARRSITLTLLVFIAASVYAYFMRAGWEFWLLGFVVALVYGGAQAVSRSLFSTLIPPEKSAEFFGFYAISAKFASIFGPLIFAIIADLTGSARTGIMALAAFFIVGLILLTLVDVDRGRAQARGENP